MKQICEYCRTHVGYLRENCVNCGAPVPDYGAAYNIFGSPHFQVDAMAMQQSAVRVQFERCVEIDRLGRVE